MVCEVCFLETLVGFTFPETRVAVAYVFFLAPSQGTCFFLDKIQRVQKCVSGTKHVKKT